MTPKLNNYHIQNNNLTLNVTFTSGNISATRSILIDMNSINASVIKSAIAQEQAIVERDISIEAMILEALGKDIDISKEYVALPTDLGTLTTKVEEAIEK